MVRVKGNPKKLTYTEYIGGQEDVPTDQLTMAHLPERVLLAILLETDPAKVDELRLSIPRIQEVFENFEGSFPPPPEFIRRVNFIINQKRNDLGNLELEVKLFRVAHHQEDPFIFYNPSFEWIKRHLKAANSMTIIANRNRPTFLRKKMPAYAKLKKFIHEHCNITYVVIHAFSSKRVSENPCEEVIDLFKRGIRIDLHTDTTMWDYFNLNPILPKVSALHNVRNLSTREMKSILQHRNIHGGTVGVAADFSFTEFIEEWKRGEREFSRMCSRINGAIDVARERTTHRENDGRNVLNVSVTGQGRTKEVLLFSNRSTAY